MINKNLSEARGLVFYVFFIKVKASTGNSLMDVGQWVKLLTTKTHVTL